jgi:hypothetical protein
MRSNFVVHMDHKPATVQGIYVRCVKAFVSPLGENGGHHQTTIFSNVTSLPSFQNTEV